MGFSCIFGGHSWGPWETGYIEYFGFDPYQKRVSVDVRWCTKCRNYDSRPAKSNNNKL